MLSIRHGGRACVISPSSSVCQAAAMRFAALPGRPKTGSRRAGALSEAPDPGRRRARHRACRRDLDRLPQDLRRPVPVRQAARHGRRDVRAGRHALPDLRRRPRGHLQALLRDDHGDARDGRNGSPPPSPSPTTSPSWTWSSSPSSGRFRFRRPRMATPRATVIAGEMHNRSERQRGAAIKASSKIATARVHPAEAPRILCGKHER